MCDSVEVDMLLKINKKINNNQAGKACGQRLEQRVPMIVGIRHAGGLAGKACRLQDARL